VAHYLGVDIGGTTIKTGIVASDGAVVASSASGWSGGQPAEAVELVARLAAALIRAHPSEEPTACGVGSAGLVDGRTGTVIASPNLPTWHDVKLADLIATSTNLPTLVDNDANAAAYAEYHIGAARGAASALMLTLGTGVGGGMVFGGRLYRGAHGFAGEVGHATIEAGGPVCACGNDGCLERFVNAGAIVERAREALTSGRPSSMAAAAAEGALTAQVVGEAANAGDAVALDVVTETGRLLGVGLANFAFILDPDVVVLGGGVSAIGQALLAPAREELERRTASYGLRLPRLVFAELGHDAGVVGAALLARDELPGR